jgi:transcriptional regulator with PAS, ATPase and Fis domain
MRKPIVRVISEAIDIRGRLLLLFREMEDVQVSDVGIPDLVCIGCDRQLSLRDLERARKSSYGVKVPVVLVAWNGSEELAIAALRHGIDDYIRGMNARVELPRILLSLSKAHPETSIASCDLLVGESDFIRSARDYIHRVAQTSSNVLVTGETGTGKDLVAKLIHRNSPRANKALVCINCAAIPDTLLESELFGAERGAYTGAETSHDGELKAADGGTAFLDEIGDMTPYAQAKILRVIETREVRRLGGGKAQHVDFRVVAATNRNLEALSQQGEFRRDLFFRLNVARIHLPPLRDRTEDLLPLAHHFREEFNRSFSRDTLGFTPRSEQAIVNYSWPGNVRELRNLVEASFITLEPGSEQVEMPDFFCEAADSESANDPGEVARILRALSESGWNKSKAADLLNWSRMTLYRKLERYGIATEGQNTSQGNRY